MFYVSNVLITLFFLLLCFRIKTERKMDAKAISAEDLVDLMIKKWNDQTNKGENIKEAHFKALDDLVSVNSLFTMAVFVGLSMAAPGQKCLETQKECQADIGYAKMLLLYEVVAFACFLLSSLVAKVIKLHLIIDGDYFLSKHFDMKDFMLIIAASSSVAGIVFLTLSVVNIIQIRIGLLSCGSKVAWWAVCGVSAIVGVGLIIYVISMGIAIFASFKSDSKTLNEGDRGRTSTGHSCDDNSNCVLQVAGVGGIDPRL